MEDVEFEPPHAGLLESYRGPIREFQAAGEPLVPFPLSFPNDDFAAFLAHLAACSRGEGSIIQGKGGVTCASYSHFSSRQ